MKIGSRAAPSPTTIEYCAGLHYEIFVAACG
jgi:hypothetical protein